MMFNTVQDETGEWVCTSTKYGPSLSWVAAAREDAYEGLRALIDDIEAGRA